VLAVGDRKFAVNGKPQYFGATPEVGLVVKAALVATEDGGFVATAVSVAGRPESDPSDQPADVQPVNPGNSTQPASAWISGVILGVDGRTVVIGAVKFQLTDATKVSGELAPAKYAKAELTRSADGSVIAVQVIVGLSTVTVVPVAPLPVITPVPGGDVTQGELQKISGRLIAIGEGSVLIGELKCEVRAGVYLSVLASLGAKPGELARYLSEKNIGVTAALRKLTTGVCVVEQIAVTGSPANVPAPVPPVTATPDPVTGVSQGSGSQEKITARIAEVEGRVWRVGDRTVIVPLKLLTEAKVGMNVIIVVRKIDHNALALWFDELTVRGLLINPLYRNFVINLGGTVYIADEVHVEQVSANYGPSQGGALVSNSSGT
jgi:hypothetical protein